MNMKLEGLIFIILSLLTISSIVVSVICLIKIKAFQNKIDGLPNSNRTDVRSIKKTRKKKTSRNSG